MAPVSSADSAPGPSEGGTVLRLAADETRESDEVVVADVAHDVRLYHFPTSLCSQKVRLVLAEKGVTWQGTLVNIGPAHEQLQPWYARINPRQVVPTLVIDGEVITDSRHIVEAIDRRFSGPTLIPEDLRDEVLRWVELQDRLPMRELELTQAKGLVRWLRRRGLGQKRKQLRKLIERHPELAEIYRHKLDDIEKLEQAIGRPNAASELVDEIDVMLDGLELHLQDQPWLAGDRYTLADAVWTAIIARLQHIGFARIMAAHRHPNIAAWYARVRERPSWDAMIRRLTVKQALRFYGPTVLKTFVLVWVLKWAVVFGLGWAVKQLAGG
jgi:glutathione S-transferase